MKAFTTRAVLTLLAAVGHLAADDPPTNSWTPLFNGAGVLDDAIHLERRTGMKGHIALQSELAAQVHDVHTHYSNRGYLSSGDS